MYCKSVKNIYFGLRFGLLNTMNTYLRKRIHVVWGGINSSKCVFIEFAIPNLYLIHFAIQKSLIN